MDENKPTVVTPNPFFVLHIFVSLAVRSWLDVVHDNDPDKPSFGRKLRSNLGQGLC